MESRNEVDIQNTIQPIAIGPCMFFKSSTKQKAHSTRLWLGSLFTTKGWRKSLANDGQWVDSFLTLYSDSTVSLRDGSCAKGRLVACVKLVDVYKKLLFGERAVSLTLRQQGEVPSVDINQLSSMMAIPTNSGSNDSLTWLFFFSQHTLNKWLVAFCRSIPAEILNEPKVLRVCQRRLKQIGKESPSLALKNHIRLFFPSCEMDPSAAGCVTAEVRINATPKRGQLQDKKQPKRAQKALRGSKSK